MIKFAWIDTELPYMANTKRGDCIMFVADSVCFPDSMEKDISKKEERSICETCSLTYFNLNSGTFVWVDPVFLKTDVIPIPQEKANHD